MTRQSEQELIDRVVGREDDPADWTALRDAAASNARVWDQLADGLEDDMLIRCAGEARLAAVGGRQASSVAFPGAEPATGTRANWLGFAFAACAACLWLFGVPSPFGEDGENGSSHVAVPSTGQVAAAPIDRQVVRELPRLIVDTEPSVDGGFEVLYVRRVLERARVQQVEAVHFDELGRPWSSAVRPASLTAPRSL